MSRLNYDKRVKYEQQKGITLIALVITIIVLLILAGVALSMLTGENSVLKRATGTKESTERAEIEEALRLAYMDYVADDVIKMTNSGSRFANAVNQVRSQGYQDKIVIASGGSTSYKLSSSSIVLGSSAPNNTAQITVEEDTSADSGGSYYAVITGKYYPISENNGNIKIAETASNVDLSGSGSSSSAISLQDSNVTFGTANVATATASGSTITVTASGTGTTTITVNVNGKNITGNVEVVSSSNFKTANLDGAMIPDGITTYNYTEDQISSSDESIAQVTTEGIIKCGTKTGTTTVKIDDKVYKVTSSARIVQAGANKTLDGSTTGTANNPIIPTGFSAINTKDAEWKDENGNNVVSSNVNNGLVIMDEKGNEFVWVPVPNAIYDVSKDGDLPTSTSSGTNNGKTYTPMAIDVATGATQNGAFNAEGTYKGILYDYNSTAGAYLKYPSATNKQGSYYREPDTVSYDGQTYTPSGSSETKTYLSIIEDTINAKYKSNSEYSNKTNFGNTMQKDYKAMVQSVATNGGFYIGRYESSLINGKTRVVAGATSMNALEDNANRWYGLYARQKNFAVDNGLTSVESDMIWGSQYDAMMNWMAKNGVDVTATETKNTYRITGKVATDKKNNIFDLLGNSLEWTVEAYSTYIRGCRGGNYVLNGSPCSRSDYGPHLTRDGCSSRPTLYIQ